MGKGRLQLNVVAPVEIVKWVLFIYKANKIVGCREGKGQEVACQLLPALVWPQLWPLCVSPLRRMWGTGRTPKKSKNVIKAWEIRAERKGHRAVGLFSLENKGLTDLKGHYMKDISCFSSPQITGQEERSLHCTLEGLGLLEFYWGSCQSSWWHRKRKRIYVQLWGYNSFTFTFKGRRKVVFRYWLLDYFENKPVILGLYHMVVYHLNSVINKKLVWSYRCKLDRFTISWDKALPRSTGLTPTKRLAAYIIYHVLEETIFGCDF